ncbi:MAG TPA: permease-like cell division protein FtsX [Candidatus Paceibacterota bacterium]|nr:permease-like cell division protein FtsX [Candidatus Paceibacterota bacterium]HMO83215.1 permease-like cell division protein FtsX [Candidatus Paceibacterota bacterium]
MLTGIKRVARAGFIGFWRNAYVSLASVFVICVALFVIGSTMFIDQLLTVSLKNLQAKVDINVYFVPNAQQTEIDAIRNAVAALPDVSSVTYTSREEALAIYRDRNKNDEIAMQALAELDDNPLGANLAIQANQTSQYESIARYLEEKRDQASAQNPVIDDVNYNQNREAIDTLTKIIATVEQASLVVMLVLILAAIMITFNTIRLAIYTAREEISIMRLVGASNMFIRGPFMLQGAMYGIIAGIIALLIFYPAMVWLGPHTESFFEFNLYNYFISNFTYIFGILLGSGIVLGLISSILAVARYLRT